ncbi:MAG: hypothetical protein POELPBGB_02946 [Bacteroidia bacterium]|nr:hypothetical protein [Bacteroidia bacterium]
MKNIFFSFFCCIATGAFAQELLVGPDVIYEYNATGNRIRRYPIISPQKTDGSDTVTTTSEEQFTQNYQNRSLPIEQQEGFNISVYPNPTQGLLTVASEPGFMGLQNKLAFVYSLKGELLFQQTITNSNFVIDFSNYALGYYIVRVLADGYGKEWKVQKQ